MLKPEQPIKSYKEDVLGRHSFAQALGKSIISYKDKNSVVIGLFGNWGSGKTSIINMAIEHIELLSKDSPVNTKPIIIHFNPWNYSDQNQLITQFFKQLSVVLRRKDYGEEAIKAGEQLETYAKIFQPLTLIPNGIGSVVGLILKGTGYFGEAAKSWGDIKSNDLNSIRYELNRLLNEQPHKIVIVIDDIDRLNNVEIRQIFQLIKLLGDFPNTIYLLAFDKDVVRNALSKVQEGSGAEYLEKVIQVPFEVPVISRSELEKLLFSQLDELVKGIPEEKWDQTYWGNVYHSGLKYFFKNIRDITRYINSLRFSFGMVKGEVNLIDFLAIIGIQVFMPDIYQGIRDNKSLFIGIYDYRGNEGKEQSKKRCDEILERTNELPKDKLIDFLKRLFPKLESVYGNMNYGSDFLGDWRRELRICSSDIFDTYFSLSLPMGEISQKEVDTILSLANNVDDFEEALLRLNDDGKTIRFLERLEDYTQSHISQGNIENVITALMNLGDLFPEGNFGFSGIDTPMRISRIIYQLIQRFDNQDERFNVLKRATEKATKSLYTVVGEVSSQNRQHSKDEAEPEDKRTVNPEQLDELTNLACAKIESWTANGRLKTHDKLPQLLFRWRDLGNKERVIKFVEDMIKDDDGLIDFITSFLSKSMSQGASDYVSRVNWTIPLEGISELINIKLIESRARDISKSSEFKGLDDKKQLAIKTFLDTVDGKIKDRF